MTQDRSNLHPAEDTLTVGDIRELIEGAEDSAPFNLFYKESPLRWESKEKRYFHSSGKPGVHYDYTITLVLDDPIHS